MRRSTVLQVPRVIFYVMCATGAGAGAEVSTKTEGSGMVLAREGAGGCESGVVCGRSPMFARYWFTAA